VPVARGSNQHNYYLEVLLVTTPSIFDEINDSMRNADVPLVREVGIQYRGQGLKAQSIRTPPGAVALGKKCIKDDSKEHFLAFFLDARHRALGRSVVSIGTATASLVHPREVYQPAVGLGAVAVILLHNHPSGDPTPSAEDRAVTKRLREAGEILGIRLIDHVVFTNGDDYYSFQEHGEIA
jgi:DNA repair protein RadC